MKHLLHILLLILGATIKAISQPTNCETIYETTDANLVYDEGMSNALMGHFSKHLLPIISKCQGKDRELITRLTIMVVVDKDGNVVDAAISNHKLLKVCEDQLKKQLLTTTGWTPAQLNGKNVCCKFHCQISCIKWN